MNGEERTVDEAGLTEELQELIESGSLFLDEKTYSEDSRKRLIEALGFAKAALAGGEEDMQRQACGRLCEAVDGLELKGGKPEAKRNKKPATWRDAAPYLICGAAVVGSAVLLAGSVIKKPKQKTGGPLSRWFGRS